LREDKCDGVTRRLQTIGWGLALPVLSLVGVALLCVFTTFAGLIPIIVGIPVFLLSTSLVRQFANAHRRIASRELRVPVPVPYRALPTSVWRRVLAVVRDPATWRDWAWLVVNSVTSWVLAFVPFCVLLGSLFYLIYPILVAVTAPEVFRTNYGLFRVDSVATAFLLWPLALLCFIIWWLIALPMMRANAHVARWLLAPTEPAALRARVSQLAASRAETVDTQAAELRRIERDLHDGAQARLVALGMNLGLAEELLASDPGAVHRLLGEARTSANAALAELRDLVRGIHPPVLADRGLDGAVRALALSSPIRTLVDVDLPQRPSAPIESAVYFAVAEAFANAAKHSNASVLTVVVYQREDVLHVSISDNGRGGARADGSGLGGIRRRLAAFDGTLTVDSPSGGPTDVRMSLPCGWSSPKILPYSETA
jgi:signal transduction histidine kinase